MGMSDSGPLLVTWHAFGQSSMASPFAQTPSGSGGHSLFGSSPSGSFLSWGASTGVFDRPSTMISSSPFGTSASFGGFAQFGQNAGFGGFGPTAAGSAWQRTQPPFGSNSFGTSKPVGSFCGLSEHLFGASTSAFSASTSPAFGLTNNPTFGGRTNPASSATNSPAFVSSTSVVGGTGTMFGVSSSGNTGSGNAFAFGKPSTPGFGVTCIPAFRSSTPFGAPTLSCGWPQPTSGGVAVGTVSSSGAQTDAFSFGNQGFQQKQLGGQQGGTRVAMHTPITAEDLVTSIKTILQSISAMPVYEHRSHEELRWEDNQHGDKGGPSFACAQTDAFAFGNQGFQQKPFGGQQGGTRVAKHTPTTAEDLVTSTKTILQSISAMPVYEHRSHEELRWEDNQHGDKGGPSFAGAQTDAFSFGNQGFQQKPLGRQQGGTRVVKHTPTTAEDLVTSTKTILQSISAMPVYEHRSHEELRWEDNQHGDKGGPIFAGQSAHGVGFHVPKQANFPSHAGTFGHTNANPFSSAAPTFLTSGTCTSTVSVLPSISSFSSLLITSSSSSFNSTPSTSLGASSIPASSTFSFNSPTSTFLGGGLNKPLFIGSNAPPSNPSTAVSSTQPSLFSKSSISHQPSAPSIGQTPYPRGQSGAVLEKTSSFTPNVSGTTTGIGLNNPGSSVLPLDNPRDFSQTSPATPVQTPSYFLAQPVTAPPTCSCDSTSCVFGHETFWQVPHHQSNKAMQPVAPVSPFGTLSTAPQMSPGRISVQFGISSMPVSEKPTSTRIPALSTPRHLSQRRISVSIRKYDAKSDCLKVPFFVDEGVRPSSEADLFIPREKPRSLVVGPTEQWPSRDSTKKQSVLKDVHNSNKENATSAGNDRHKEQHNHPLSPPKSDTQALNIEPLMAKLKISRRRAGDANIASKSSTDIEALLPNLRHCDYYTEPRIQELADKERAEPGFCCNVKGFVVGRHGYGCIKFYGETDVRRLDLESIIQFNDREVLVYMGGSVKPPVGQGLNKPAEVTLLNVKCVDKKTGVHHTEGLGVEKYKEMLVKTAEMHGAEFVSYDAVKGLWKFNVRCF